MKNILRAGVFTIAFGLMFFAFSLRAQASEGLVELRNSTGGDARCFAMSVLMPDLNHNVLVSCRDILYPGGVDIFSYVVWATPLNGGGDARLGELGVGKVLFKTKTSFSTLYVTRERNKNTRSPEGPVVMRGNVRGISYLETGKPTAVGDEQAELVTPLPEAERPSGGISALQIGGIVAAFLLVGVVGFVLVLVRRV